MHRRFRHIAKHAYFGFLLRSGATRWARRRLEVHGQAIVITFHRVLDDDAFRATNSPAGMVVHRRTFADLIRVLASEVEFVSVSDLPRPAASRSHRLPVAITFDDGWSDNLQTCVDVLTPRSIPACIFVCSSMVGRISPFWPEQVLSGLRTARSVSPVPQNLIKLFAAHGMDLLHRSEHDLLQHLKRYPEARSAVLAAFGHLPPFPGGMTDTTMTWDELRLLKQHGIELGCHTANHEILTNLSPPNQVAELLDCNKRMEEELKVSPSFFSYPDGAWNEAAKQSVASCGYRYAFINASGVWSEDVDQHLVPRVNLSQNRLVGSDGRFSVASAHYYIFWLPYLNRKRNRARTGDSPRNILSALLRFVPTDALPSNGKWR